MDRTVRSFVVGCLLSLCSVSHADCPFALPPHHSGFCESFKIAAQCRCYANNMPSFICGTTESIYKQMTTALGSVQRACATQRDTTVQECIDDWNCYRYGGLTSNGQLCSSSGHACA